MLTGMLLLVVFLWVVVHLATIIDCAQRLWEWLQGR
jgi:hypothetical protein